MKTYTVLIIDDDPTTHEILGDYLALSGIRVVSAEDGRIGVETARREKPDLIILDIQMPEMDGFEVIRVLKAGGETAETPILFLSSLSRTILKVKGLQLGAEDYIVKPFDKAEVLARVQGAFRRSARYRRIEGSLEGDLEDISLVELLQTLEMGRKTACISFADMGGEIHLRNGAVSAATWKGFQGREALRRMLLIERGTYAADFRCTPRALMVPPLAVQDFLLSDLAYMDELAVILSKFERLGGSSTVKRAISMIPEWNSSQITSSSSIEEMIALIPGDLKKNAEALMEAAQKAASDDPDRNPAGAQERKNG